MIKEHALRITKDLTQENLDYLVNKANRLGLKNRRIALTTMEKDPTGTHVYFHCEGPRNEQTN